MQLFLKTLTLGLQILCSLHIFRQSACLSLLHQLSQLAVSHLFEFFLSRHYVHRQFLEIRQVRVVHLVHHSDVLEQLHLMTLQDLADAFHIGLDLGVTRLQSLDLVLSFLEKSEQTFLFLGIEAFELCHYSREQVPDFTEILSLHLFESRLGKVRHLLLSPCTILQYSCRVIQIYLLCECIDHLLFFRRQHRFFDSFRLFCHYHLCGFCFFERIQRQ